MKLPHSNLHPRVCFQTQLAGNSIPAYLLTGLLQGRKCFVKCHEKHSCCCLPSSSSLSSSSTSQQSLPSWCDEVHILWPGSPVNEHPDFFFLLRTGSFAFFLLSSDQNDLPKLARLPQKASCGPKDLGVQIGEVLLPTSHSLHQESVS